MDIIRIIPTIDPTKVITRIAKNIKSPVFLCSGCGVGGGADGIVGGVTGGIVGGTGGW